jgi:hypothetical protein
MLDAGYWTLADVHVVPKITGLCRLLSPASFLATELLSYCRETGYKAFLKRQIEIVATEFRGLALLRSVRQSPVSQNWSDSFASSFALRLFDLSSVVFSL